MSVDVVSGLVPQASDLENKQYVFAYNITFTNNSNETLRVLSREYQFAEASGEMASQILPGQPEAAGVVGFTPRLRPGERFEFGSGVSFRSELGTMMGNYLIMTEPELDGEELRMHEEMEKAELMIRFVYYKGLGTPQFRLLLGPLRFDANVTCVDLARA